MIVGGSTLALANSWSSNHVCLHRGDPLIWLFLVVVANKFDLGRLQNNHVITAAAFLALAAPPPVLADAAAAALLALAAIPPVLADAATAALLAPEALPPVLANAAAAALLACAAMPPVLADAFAAALLALAALPPVLAEAAAAAFLALEAVRAGHLASRSMRLHTARLVGINSRQVCASKDCKEEPRCARRPRCQPARASRQPSRQHRACRHHVPASMLEALVGVSAASYVYVTYAWFRCIVWTLVPALVFTLHPKRDRIVRRACSAAGAASRLLPRRARPAAQHYPAQQRCTAPLGLLDSLPAEVPPPKEYCHLTSATLRPST